MFRFTNLIIFRFTRDCNLNCEYCFMTNKHEFKGEMIDHEDFKKMVHEIIKQRILNRQGHDLEFVIHGGEALMIGKKRFYQSVEYLRNAMDNAGIKVHISMQTNGVLLDDEYTKIINKFNIHVGLSFDGIDNSNKDRGVKEQVFEKKFKILEKNKVDYGFLVVAGKNNIDNIKKTRKYLEKKNLGYKINYAEDMINPGVESSIEVDGVEFFNKVYKPELNRYLKTGKSPDHQMLTYLKRTVTSLLTFYEDEEHSGCGKLFCGSAIGMIGVNPDGTSHYCDRYDREYDDTYVMNNLTDYDFLGMHQIKRAMDFNQKRHYVVLETGCDTCFARDICEGGCTAFYRSKYGKDGIDKKIVCGLYKSFYSYVLENFDKFAKSFIKHNISFNCDKKFIGVKQDMINILMDYGVRIKIECEDVHKYSIKFKENNKEVIND